MKFNFSELFIKGKYVKIRFKSRGPASCFLSSRAQKIKNILKIEQKRLIYKINIRFNFVSGSIFQQDHLLNLFISGVYAKR